ncbi:MAG: hypothetical protein A2V90_01810 [Gammaproteobacteria bacterium RBG_16_57_12]|nr:MAG: hypothetical protein A2V90_01810 [Gammaproteobacteria bacterium RBG_16_57_12]
MLQNVKGVTDLPLPTPEAQRHSEQLIAQIRAEMEAHGGRLDFARYMALALYSPGLGYYAAGARKFGAAGDFVTAPEISPQFSRCLARQCQQVLAQLPGGAILEFGAGTGAMAGDILLELERCHALPSHYFILDVSAELRQRQQQTLLQRVPRLLDRVQWLDRLPIGGFRGVVLANEVLDAMPVHRFQITAEGYNEIYVAWQGERFAWSHERPGAALEAWYRAATPAGLAPGYESEVNLAIAPWLAGLVDSLAAGAVLLIDYGFPRHEYYHPQRSGGTLMCHYRHRAHPDPLILPGLQDITAHVDFTAVAEAALDAGFEVLGFTNQAYFLLALGLAESVAEVNPLDTRAQLELAQQIKKLTLPSEMGELFKVMALGKGLDMTLRGFTLNDQRGRL